MDIRQLGTFRILAHTLSFTQAATTLNYAQSTVTAQIQALESELGIPLFDRLGRRVALTDAGRRLLHYAERILDLAEEAQRVVTSSDEPGGVLTISAPESVCIYRLPSVLREYRARCPNVRLLFRPVACRDALQYVSGGEVDVAFVLDTPLGSSHLFIESLITEPILVVAPANHPLTRLPRVMATDMEGESVVLTETGCSYRAAFERDLEAVGIRPTSMLEFSNVEAIKQCIMAGMGIGVLPQYVVAAELAQGHLVALPWAEADLTMVTQMVWHQQRWASPALRAFLEVAREQVGQESLIIDKASV